MAISFSEAKEVLTVVQASTVTPIYCHRDICAESVRPGRVLERSSSRWAPDADSAIHGGEPKTVIDLRERYDGRIPHRTILRVRTQLRKALSASERTQAFAGRILQHLDLPVPDTVGAGKSHCRTEQICVNQMKRRNEEQPILLRWGKAKERANFLTGSVERRKEVVQRRFGIDHTRRRRDMVPIAERGDPPPQMRNQRFY